MTTYIHILCVIGVIISTAQVSALCPSSNPYTTNCYCDDVIDIPSGMKISCGVIYFYYDYPEQIKSALGYYQQYGQIVEFEMLNIQQSYFSYVPDDFLSGNLIPIVRFQCNHQQSVNGGHLTFSIDAFNNASGVCGLTGSVTFSDCNLRQFNSITMKNCNQLEKLAFMNSHVESIVELPTLESLTNFTVYYPYLWTAATQRGLTRLSLAQGASLPRLQYLDLSGNSLTDEYIQFVSRVSEITEMHLEGNLFTYVPDMTANINLQTVSMTLSFNSTVSIRLPNPRNQTQPLKAKFISKNRDITNDVNLIEGMFGEDTLDLNLYMTIFDENVFLLPLESSNVTVYLNPEARILCGCNISWLVRDNRDLLSRVINGTCTDGRPFESIPAEEVSCCSIASLLKRIETLKVKGGNVKLKNLGESLTELL